jgi:hypothetical protein
MSEAELRLELAALFTPEGAFRPQEERGFPARIS